MQRITLALALVITLFVGPALAQKPMKPMKVKLPKVSMSIDNKTTVVVYGTQNSTTVGVSADNSQNVSYTIVDGRQDHRQWHDSHDDHRQYHETTTTTTVDSRQLHFREGDTTSTYAPVVRYAPVQATPVVELRDYPPSRLTYSSVLDRPTTIAVRCWGYCGGYFIDAEGRRFTLLPTYSKVPSEYRHMTLPGHYWRSSGGTLYYAAAWGSVIRTFVYSGL
ncbi:MAG: hypothetical protein KBA40_03150 [Candidatus Peribacteraceae bacterium]|nr:hypothetical protein [Candidatus Peribacteraceae bacterium]MBP9850498.1 hypothetical protein [Candidatus Peribacteraceae bacterium]